MYACNLETGRGFFEGVCALSDQDCISSDPPPHTSRIDSRECHSQKLGTGRVIPSRGKSLKVFRIVAEVRQNTV
jgi:hypothetical protein